MILINSSPKNALKVFQPFLPIYVPIGIASLATMAERKGIKVLLIDEQVEEDIIGLAVQYARQLQPPYIFGFSVLTIAVKNALAAAKELKRIYPESFIVFGGIHPSAMPDEMLSRDQVDIVVRGEADEVLFELYECIKAGRDYTGIHNLSFRRDGKIVHNEIKFLQGSLDDYPPFPYDLFASNNRYDYGFVISSRGCPYRCIFCSNRVVTGKRYRTKSPQRIVDELTLLLQKYRQRHILFIDDNFLVNKERIYSLINLIKAKGLHREMSFSFQARGDNVNPGLLKDLFDAGFRSVFFGIETASEDIMEVIKKDETVAQCAAGVKMAREAGFNTSATFIYGLPTETHRDRMDCLRLSKELKLDLVRYNNATPYPGTELYEIAKIEKRLNISGLYENFISTSTFIENPFKQIPFAYVPPGNTEAQIRRDLLLSYFSFYIDFGRLKRMFFRPPEQNLGWFDSGEKLAEKVRKIPALLFLAVTLCCKLMQLGYYLFLKPETAIGYRYFGNKLRAFRGRISAAEK